MKKTKYRNVQLAVEFINTLHLDFTEDCLVIKYNKTKDNTYNLFIPISIDAKTFEKYFVTEKENFIKKFNKKLDEVIGD